MRSQPRRRFAFALWAAAAIAACDGSGRPSPDPGDEGSRTEGGQTLSELLVRLDSRLDAQSAGLPSASLVAYKARVLGIESDQVAGAVDPLMVAGPDGRCALRQVDETVRLLREAHGGVELEALSRFTVELSASEVLRPLPRVYPDLASVVTGVVAEAGPEDLVELPETLTLKSEAGPDVLVRLPALPQVLAPDGTPVRGGTKFSAREDLHLVVVGPKGSFVELRPFGATTWAACPMSPEGHVTIPADVLYRLAGPAGQVPVSLDVVWRNRRPVQLGGTSTRLSLETRASALVELQP